MALIVALTTNRRTLKGQQSDEGQTAPRRFLERLEATSLDELNERYPRGSRERQLFAEFLGFYEGAGVLISRALLHEDVYFDAPFTLTVVWPKVQTIVDEMRDLSRPHEPPANYFHRKDSGGGVTVEPPSRRTPIFTVGPASGTSA